MLAWAGMGLPASLLVGVWVLLVVWYSQSTMPRFWDQTTLPPGRGVYVREIIDGRPASFTRGHARWPLPASLEPSQSILITFQARSPSAVEQRRTQVWLSYQSFVRFDITPEWRSYALLLPHNRPARGASWLVFDTDEHQFGEDPRPIGLVLRHVMLNSLVSYQISGTDIALLLASLGWGSLLMRRMGLPPLVSIVIAGLLLFSLRAFLPLPPLLLVSIVMGGSYGAVTVLPALRRWTWPRLPMLHLAVRVLLIIALLLLVLALLAPSLLHLTVQLVGLVTAGYAVLLYAGFGITWFLRSRRLAPALPLFTPVVGMASLSAVGHALAYLPWGTDQTGWPIMALFTLVNIRAWHQGARPQLPRRYRLALLGVVMGLLAGLLPLYQLGYLTTVGTTIDAIAYLTRADYIQTSGLRTIPNYADGIPNSSSWAASQIIIGIREGDAFLVALLSSLLHVRAYQTFPILMAIWYSLPPLGVFLVMVYQFHLPRVFAVVASLLVAVQPLTHWPLLEDHLSQVAGTAVWLFVWLTVLAALRGGGWRTVVLAGLMLAGLATFYPAYLIYMLPVIALTGCYEWYRQLHRRRAYAHSESSPRKDLQAALLPLLKRGGGLLAATLIINPMGWYLLGREVSFISGAVGGSIYAFPHPAEIIGLYNHAAYLSSGANLPGLPLLLLNMLFSICLAFMLYALVRGRDHQRWLAGILVLVLLGALGHMRFLTQHGQGYPYGYFKVASLLTPVAVMLLVWGLLLFYRNRQRLAQTPAIVRRIARGLPPLLLATCFSVATMHTFTASAFDLRQFLIADSALLEATQAMAFVPANEPLLVIEPRSVKPNWLSYLIKHPLTFFRTHLRHYGSHTQIDCPLVARYALLGLPREQQGRPVRFVPWQTTEPWDDPARYRELWRGREFVLLRRTDNPLADVPLDLVELDPVLNRPLWIRVTQNRLFLVGQGVARVVTVQRYHLDAPPARLEVTLESKRGGVVLLQQGDARQYIPLRRGSRRIQIPIEHGSLTVRLQQPRQPRVSVRLATVRVLAEERRKEVSVEQ